MNCQSFLLGDSSLILVPKVVSDMTELLPELVSEMDKLRKLAPDMKKSKEEQKKAAGFIQQRKRAGLNTLFKTLQSIGFSYRFGPNII